MLHLYQPLSTSVTDLVELRGGVIKGEDVQVNSIIITNDGANGIVGHGTITAAVNDDRLIVTRTLMVRNATFDVDLLGSDPMAGDEFDVLDVATFVDQGSALNLPDLLPGLAWDTSDFEAQGILRVVPEPGTAAMLLLALAAIGGRRWA